jgi:hypothetical protein
MAGGLVDHQDGAAPLTNLFITGVSNAAPNNTPVPVIVRCSGGQQSWKTFLGAPAIHDSFGVRFTI